jgi:microcystin-dependent protein
MNATTITFNTSTSNLFYNFGATEPSVDNRIYPWYRTGASGDDGWYYWNTTHTKWVMPHPVPASSAERRLYVGTELSLLTYDGGENAAVDVDEGPFWEVDHDFDFRFLLGPGTSPGGTVVAVNATGGAETHTLTEAEIPEHLHYIVSDTVQGSVSFDNTPVAGKAIVRTSSDPGGDREYFLCSEDGATPKATVGDSSTVGDGDAHNIIPPYRATFVIKRTARIYRTV